MTDTQAVIDQLKSMEAGLVNAMKEERAEDRAALKYAMKEQTRDLIAHFNKKFDKLDSRVRVLEEAA